MATLTPAEITTRSEHSALANAGEMGGICQTCARPVQVQFFYDDPLNTPITDLEVQFVDHAGAILIDGIPTEAPMSRGLQDATTGVGAVRSELGDVLHGEVPFSAGALTVTTNTPEDIPSSAAQAWQLEQDIVGDLEAFEQSMKVQFQPYIEEWEREGMMGAGRDYYEGIGKGIAGWWDGEKDFWGTAWGALKSSTAAIENYLNANPELYLGLPGAMWHLQELGQQAGNALAEWWAEDGDNVIDFIGNLTELMKGFLTADIDKIFEELENLTGLEDFPGAIGEFGVMLKDAFADGVDWLRDMLEVLRRTPVLGLMANTAMRCLLMMTPNFWAKVIGEGVGFVIPEVLIWAITSIIAALSAGAGAAVLAARCAGIASKIRGAIKGSQHVAHILSFMDGLRPVFNKIGDLAKALRRSIDEAVGGVIDTVNRVPIVARYWRGRLDDLARQGHGPQRHEGDVTDRQLRNRSLHGFDPMTNSPVDFEKFRKKYSVEYNPIAHGTPPDFGGRTINVPGKGDLPIIMNNKIRHVAGDHATKFNTPADFVRAHDEIVKSPDFAAFVNSGDLQKPVSLSARDIFGPHFQSRLKGYDLGGSQTVFGPDTKILAIFRNDGGVVKLVTMYPEP